MPRTKLEDGSKLTRDCPVELKSARMLQLLAPAHRGDDGSMIGLDDLRGIF